MSPWQDIGIHSTAIKEVLHGSQYAFETVAISGRKEEFQILYALINPGIPFLWATSGGKENPLGLDFENLPPKMEIVPVAS
jgi:hypothetical protein